MLPIQLLSHERPSPAILCLGAHSDDIEIGAGGTILSLVERYPDSRILWVVFSGAAQRGDEARSSGGAVLAQAKHAEIIVHAFRDGFFPAEFAQIKTTIESMKNFEPDIVFSHYRGDHHQDHRVISELTWNTFRNHLILEYEVPKYDPDLGNPSLFVPLSREQAESKVAALMVHFRSQRDRSWFVPETFFALLRLRGVQAAAPSGYAEAFYARKLWLIP